MQVTETLSDGLKRAWSVVVPAEDIGARRAKRLAEIGRTANIPGFRPGKIPATVITKRFGTAVMAEVLEESVNSATQQVLTDRGLRPAQQPKVDVVSLDEGKDLAFNVEVELLPEIKLPDFGMIELTRLKAAPEAAAIDKALSEIATRNAELVVIEEVRPAVKGDILSVDFIGKIDGEPFQGGTAEGIDVEVAGEGFIPGFTEQVEGMSPGESRTINVSFPEEYGAKELAGKAATFDISAKSLKQRSVPAIDDDLAKKLGFDEIARVRDLISGQMQREYDNVSRNRIKRALLDALAALSTFPAPESMVTAEFDTIWQRLEADKAQGEGDEADKAKDEDTLKAEYRAIAERRVKLGLLLSEIGQVHNIKVAPEEMTRAMRMEAGRYQGQEQMVMDFFRKNPQAAESLRGPLLEEKVVDFVIELAKVTESVVSIEELTKEPEPAG
ncbi:MAG: trigger factor [Alphaproteobacteria bacterium]|nr:trigger factor [Alphaproteobacteria bacterium]